jgi:phage I-like protein
MSKQQSLTYKTIAEAPMRGEFLVALRLTSTSDGATTKRVQILPSGTFRARDGRPGTMSDCTATHWYLDASIAARLIADFNATSMPLLFDYEHQTLNSEANGQPAPAAGWGVQLAWQEDGLYAEMQWTEKARSHIQADEYRFISPVFEFDPQTGAVLRLLHCALTNFPALTGMNPVTARHADSIDLVQVHEMKLKPETAALLGLSDGQTDDAEALHSAIAALKASPPAQTATLSATPDLAQYVPVSVVEELKQQLAALTATQNSNEVAALIKQGKEDGKLLPAQEAWATELGKSNVAALRQYLSATPAVAALKGNQTGGKAPAANESAGLSDAEREAARIGGWDAGVFGGGK